MFAQYAATVIAISDYYLDGPGAFLRDYAHHLHQVADAIEEISKKEATCND